MLSDVTAARRQSEEVEAKAREEMRRTFANDDRIALLVTLEADQLALREMQVGPYLGVFRSRIDAECWLRMDGRGTGDDRQALIDRVAGAM